MHRALQGGEKSKASGETQPSCLGLTLQAVRLPSLSPVRCHHAQPRKRSEEGHPSCSSWSPCFPSKRRSLVWRIRLPNSDVRGQAYLLWTACKTGCPACCCAGVQNVTMEDVETPNYSTLIIKTLELMNKPGLAAEDDEEMVAALQGLYTLWYFAGVSLGILPPLPGQEKDIRPHVAVDWPITESTSIKDGRLGYTNGTVLTWQVSLHIASISGHFGCICMPEVISCNALQQNVEQSVPVTALGKVVVPSTVEDVVSIVKAAAAVPGGNIRCIAHGSSWTSVFFDEARQAPFAWAAQRRSPWHTASNPAAGRREPRSCSFRSCSCHPVTG